MKRYSLYAGWARDARRRPGGIDPRRSPAIARPLYARSRAKGTWDSAMPSFAISLRFASCGSS